MRQRKHLILLSRLKKIICDVSTDLPHIENNEIESV